MTKYKILCLHGVNSSGAILKKKLEVWPSNVVEKMDFMFIDALFPADTEPFPSFMRYDTQVQYLLQINTKIS